MPSRGPCAILLLLFAAGCNASSGSADAPVVSTPDASLGEPSLAPSPRPPPRPGRGAPPIGPLSVDGGDDAEGDAETADASDDGSSSAGDAGEAGAPGSWAPVKNTPFFAAAPLLLTDGTVLVHAVDDASWWRLAPDSLGSYTDGRWSEVSPLPADYEPTFFASAVLADGRVLVMGGEYDRDALVETTLGAIYDPPSDVWTPVAIPDGWLIVGDAPSVVLPDGTFMLGDPYKNGSALFDARTLSWTEVPATSGYVVAESGWSLLPSGKVLSVDVETNDGWLFDPTAGAWAKTSSIPVALADSQVFEIGPELLMPDGRVFAVGATLHTALYQTDGTWVAGPDMPAVQDGQLDAVDGPAALTPGGHVVFVASPGDYEPGSVFFDFDGTTLTQLPAPVTAPQDSSYNYLLLVLPSGQILETDGSTDVEVYTPVDTPDPSWAPAITSVAATLARGTTNRLEGTQLNGLSQAVAYGDDYQAATNYPLVRITNGATGHVVYARTHDHSSMGVATGAQIVSTLFDVPAAAETGPSELVVVANGIASTPTPVTIQ
jgi:hypothetical protein